MGRYWHRDIEVDILGRRVAGECKWSDGVDPSRVLYQLEEKVNRLDLRVERYVVVA